MRERLGELGVLEEMAELALRAHYPKVLKDNSIDAIGEPKIEITKLAAGNPLTFKITTAIYPKFKLPDYRARAAKHFGPPIEASASDEEVTKFIESWRKQNLPKDTLAEAALPPLTDELVRTWGDFKDVADFQTKVREQIVANKRAEARDKRRIAFLKELGEAAAIIFPPLLREAELDKMLGEMKGEIERFGLNFENYLTHLKKTEADLRQEWQGQADERVRGSLVLEAIASAEKLEPPAEKLEIEIKHLLEHYPKADPARARSYIANRLVNDLIWEKLETEKK